MIDKDQFNKELKEYLYQHSGTPNDVIDKTLCQEKDWIDMYYEEGLRTGDFEHALDLAEANLGLWI